MICQLWNAQQRLNAKAQRGARRNFFFFASLGALEWLRTTYVIRANRIEDGREWHRMAIILGGVALFTFLSMRDAANRLRAVVDTAADGRRWSRRSRRSSGTRRVQRRRSKRGYGSSIRSSSLRR